MFFHIILSKSSDNFIYKQKAKEIDYGKNKFISFLGTNKKDIL
jgi:hypothetical protein